MRLSIHFTGKSQFAAVFFSWKTKAYLIRHSFDSWKYHLATIIISMYELYTKADMLEYWESYNMQALSCLVCPAETQISQMYAAWLRGHKTFFFHTTQLSMNFFLLINIKMPTIVGILIFISRKNFMLSSAVQEESLNCWYLIFYRQNKFPSQLSWAWKKFYNLGPWSVIYGDSRNRVKFCYYNHLN